MAEGRRQAAIQTEGAQFHKAALWPTIQQTLSEPNRKIVPPKAELEIYSRLSSSTSLDYQKI